VAVLGLGRGSTAFS